MIRKEIKAMKCIKMFILFSILMATCFVSDSATAADRGSREAAIDPAPYNDYDAPNKRGVSPALRDGPPGQPTAGLIYFDNSDEAEDQEKKDQKTEPVEENTIN